MLYIFYTYWLVYSVSQLDCHNANCVFARSMSFLHFLDFAIILLLNSSVVVKTFLKNLRPRPRP